MINPSSDPDNYPFDGLTPTIRAMAEYIHMANQSPPAMCGISALAGCTLAVQGLVKVQWRRAPASPVGMIFIVEALSGERKTANDQLALEEHRRFDQKQSSEEARHARTRKLAETVWLAQRKEMVRKLVKLTDVKELAKQQALLDAHDLNPPPRPKLPRMLISDITAPAIGWHLSERYPYAGLVSDEGGVILSSGALSNPAMINSIWDHGGGVTDRMGRGRTEVYDASLTIYLQVQPGVFETFLGRSNNLTHSSGNSSRWLYAKPTSTQSMRKNKYADLPDHDKETYNARIRELLLQYEIDPLEEWTNGKIIPKNEIDEAEALGQDSIETKNSEQQREEIEQPAQAENKRRLPDQEILTLKEGARNILEWFSDTIEDELAERGYFVSMRGAAAKAPENCARLAAVMHRFENNESNEIESKTMRGAIKIVAWHLRQYRKRFAPLTPLEREVQEVEDRISQIYVRWEKTHGRIKNAELARQLRKALRPTEKLFDICVELEAQNKVTIWEEFNSMGRAPGWSITLDHWFPTLSRLAEGKDPGPRQRTPGYADRHEPRMRQAAEAKAKADASRRQSSDGYELWPGVFLP